MGVVNTKGKGSGILTESFFVHIPSLTIRVCQPPHNSTALAVDSPDSQRKVYMPVLAGPPIAAAVALPSLLFKTHFP